MDRLSIGFASTLLCASLAGCGGAPQVAGPNATASQSDARYRSTIRWTAYGVPHIKANDWGSLGYGLAYAVATDGVCILAREFVVVRGEQAKFFGPEEGRREADVFHKATITEKAIATAGERTPKEMLALQTGYVAGYNRYLADHTGDKLPLSCRNQPWVKPIDLTDLARLSLGVGIRYGVGRAQTAIANAAPPSVETKTSAIASAEPQLAQDGLFGSNAVALGKLATVNGRGMLLGNPHYPWTGPSRFHMAHLTIPGQLDLMGVGLFTTQFVSIGFNRDVAWTHTVSTGLRYTLYELELDPADPLAYRYDGNVRKITPRTVAIEVRTNDGRVATETHTIYESHLGPMLEDKELSWTRERAYAIRDSNLQNNRATEQYFKFGRAKSVEDMLKAMQSSQGIAWVNTIAADRHGKALYADLSVVPNVDESLIKRCSSTIRRWREAPTVVLKASPECEWRNDPRAQQAGILPPQELPWLIRDDYVTNSNDSHWLSNPKQPLEGFSPIIGAERSARSLRTRAGLVMVSEVLEAQAARQVRCGSSSGPSRQSSELRRRAGAGRRAVNLCARVEAGRAQGRVNRCLACMQHVGCVGSPSGCQQSRCTDLDGVLAAYGESAELLAHAIRRERFRAHAAGHQHRGYRRACGRDAGTRASHEETERRRDSARCAVGLGAIQASERREDRRPGRSRQRRRVQRHAGTLH